MRNINEVIIEASTAHKNGDLQKAEGLYCQILAAKDDIWEIVTALGTLYAQVGAHGRALITLKHAIELNPQNQEAMANIATVYRQQQQVGQAIEWNQRALAVNAENPVTLSNLAGAYINDGNPELAYDWAVKALAIAPDMPEAGNHKALALLEMGDWVSGFAAYDARLRIPGFHTRKYDAPMWDGKPTDLLAIHGEQGLGDEILFLTWLRQVLAITPNVVVECATRLVGLLQNSFPAVRFYGTHAELVAVEKPTAWIPMGSLPRVIWPVAPNAYLKPTRPYEDPEWCLRKPRIGLSWRGGTMLTHSRLRNFKLDHWKHLLGFEADYLSLQYGDRTADAKELGIPHDAESIADLDRLAAMIQSCDLVVSVCNTTIHLAGALGVPCVCLVPSKPAWRYGPSGDKTPWYDSVQLIRQGKDEDWRSVIDRVRRAIIDHGFVPRAKPQAARIAA